MGAGVCVPRWKQGGEFDSYGNSPRRHNGDTDRGEATEMLRGGPGYILKESMTGLANGLHEGDVRMKLTAILRF